MPNRQFNGNIGQISWRTTGGSGTTTTAQHYSFTYDKMNRLKKAMYQNTGKNSFFDVSGTADGIDYDANGNIMHMERYRGLGATRGKIDDLHYTYQAGNRLHAVADQGDAAPHTDATNATILKVKDYGFRAKAGSESSHYEYDHNVNLKKDPYKGISAILYNHLNLPREVQFTDGSTVRYTYTASGAKLRKTYLPTTGDPKTTDYLGGIHYTNGAMDFMQHSEGRLQFATGRYEYDLKDHLGNVRATVAPVENENTTQVLTPELVQGSGRSSNWPGVVSSNIISLVNNKIEVKAGVQLVMLDAHYRMEQGREYTISLRMPSNSKPPKVEFGIWDGNNLIQKINAPTLGGTVNYTYVPLATSTYRLLVQVVPQSGTNPVRITSLSVTRRGTTTWQVVQRDDYYPYGLTFNSYTSGTENLYKYNGKEVQKALGLYDYGARYYDPAIGRFTTIDSLSEAYYDWSPYNYVGGNPIARTDEDGKFWNFVVGAAIGAGTEYVGQVVGNVIKSGNGVSALYDASTYTNVDFYDVGVAAVAGAATSGASAFTKATINVAAEVTKATIDVNNTTEGVEIETILDSKTLGDAGVDLITGLAGTAVDESITKAASGTVQNIVAEGSEAALEVLTTVPKEPIKEAINEPR